VTDSLPTPYKAEYTLADWWPELTKGTLWKTYAKNNPVEAAALDRDVQHKINGEAHMTPHGLTHTFTGNALLMVILSLTPGATKGDSHA
jgi:hypothetical protein